MSSIPTIGVAGGGGAVQPARPDSAERLRRTARDLEGVFVEQLFKAMRETVPSGGLVDGGTGEQMFSALLDQKMAAVAPARWEHGLSEALMRQLGSRIGAGGTPPGESGATTPRTIHPASSSETVAAPILNLNDVPDVSRPESS